MMKDFLLKSGGLLLVCLIKFEFAIASCEHDQPDYTMGVVFPDGLSQCSVAAIAAAESVAREALDCITDLRDDSFTIVNSYCPVEVNEDDLYSDSVVQAEIDGLDTSITIEEGDSSEGANRVRRLKKRDKCVEYCRYSVSLMFLQGKCKKACRRRRELFGSFGSSFSNSNPFGTSSGGGTSSFGGLTGGLTSTFDTLFQDSGVGGDQCDSSNTSVSDIDAYAAAYLAKFRLFSMRNQDTVKELRLWDQDMVLLVCSYRYELAANENVAYRSYDEA